MNASTSTKREQAEARNAKWAAKSFDEQIAYLDNLFGKGKGAAKQRAKIAKQMEVAAVAPAKKKTAKKKEKS